MEDQAVPGSEPLKDPRREMFCHQYVVDFIATKAAIRAGYSEKTAGSIASRLLKEVNISERVKYLTEKVVENVKIDAEWVLRELALMYQADHTQIMDEMGNIIDPKDWPEDVKKVITQFDVTSVMDNDGNTGGMLVQKVKRTDRLQILDRIGKHKGVQAFKENVEVEAGQSLVEAIMAGRKRARRESDENDEAES